MHRATKLAEEILRKAVDRTQEWRRVRRTQEWRRVRGLTEPRAEGNWAKEEHFDKRIAAGDPTALADVYRDAIERLGKIADTLDEWLGILG